LEMADLWTDSIDLTEYLKFVKARAIGVVRGGGLQNSVLF
jgi:hypothetical protein